MTHDRAYFRWLVKKYLKDSEGEPDGYACLLEQMFRKSYYYIVPNDENRAEDGLDLRDAFLITPLGRKHGGVPEGPCSFLEFLIGVSIRLSDLLIDGEPIPVDEYFWELASRLRLTEYTDDLYSDERTTFIVDNVMTDFMDRKYGRCGDGGLFPLSPPCRNQRKTEVWYQLNTYLLENPDFFEV
jgi:hypothetical protein